MADSEAMVLPGATIGMVGGGQLGRMFALAASAMGYRVIVLADSDQSPAGQVAHEVVAGPLDNVEVIDRFASQCDVITLEFENIPAATIARCSEHAPTFPSASVLATSQDRLVEKGTLRDHDLPVTPFLPVSDRESVLSAARELGWPLIVKTATAGYDGKGQFRVESAADIEEIDWSQCDRWIAEQCIPFQREVSAVVARTPAGSCESFPVFENVHRNHILDVTSIPSRLDDSVEQSIRRIAQKAAEALDVVGLLCIEFFVIDGGRVMINEVAPRPHNSGHLTIEACETSQFEQHVRAVCNLPLGSTSPRCPAAAMVNLLGDLWTKDGHAPPWELALSDGGVSLHLYGKQTAKVGRKMGHLTVTGDRLEDVVERAEAARSRLQVSGD